MSEIAISTAPYSLDLIISVGYRVKSMLAGDTA